MLIVYRYIFLNLTPKFSKLYAEGLGSKVLRFKTNAEAVATNYRAKFRIQKFDKNLERFPFTKKFRKFLLGCK